MNPTTLTYQYNNMSKKEIPTLDQARAIGEQLGVRWDKFEVEQFRAGLGVELEHGTVDPGTNVTDDDPLVTGKIALAHLTEFPDYYTRLAKMEEEAKSFWNSKKPKKAISGSGRRSGNRKSVRVCRMHDAKAASVQRAMTLHPSALTQSDAKTL